MIFADVRIEDEDGKFLGVGGMALELYNIQDLIRNYEDEYGIEVLFLDDEGQPQIESGSIKEYALEKHSIPDKENLEQITKDGKFLNISYTITRYIEPLDWYMIIHDINPYDYTVDYMVIVLNLIIFAVLFIISIISVNHIRLGAGTLFSESYIDNMTGLYNRRAYDDNLDTLSRQENLKNITVVVFDVNGLKKVNDTMGHAAGDELIKAAATLISATFGSYGKCYRTGGDEFVAILTKPIENMDKLTGSFEETQHKWRGDYINKISISYGYIKGDEYNCSIDRMIFHADEQMYRRKKKYYSNEKNNRRKK
jgi:diguanylate cyclase (GGDEF)-like protein